MEGRKGRQEKIGERERGSDGERKEGRKEEVGREIKRGRGKKMREEEGE